MSFALTSSVAAPSSYRLPLARRRLSVAVAAVVLVALGVTGGATAFLLPRSAAPANTVLETPVSTHAPSALPHGPVAEP